MSPSNGSTSDHWTGKQPFSKPTGSCVNRFASAVGFSAGAGAFAGACIMAWSPGPVVGEGIVPREGLFTGLSPSYTSFSTTLRGLGRPAMFFSMAGGTFAAVECMAEELRQSSDSWNALIGGMAAGAVMAAPRRRLDVMAGAALGVGLFMCALDFAGPGLSDYNSKRLENKFKGVRSTEFQESERVAGLKEMYPTYVNNSPKQQ